MYTLYFIGTANVRLLIKNTRGGKNIFPYFIVSCGNRALPGLIYFLTILRKLLSHVDFKYFIEMIEIASFVKRKLLFLTCYFLIR